MQAHYLGMDIGTSGCKAVIFDAAGIEVARAYREYNVLSPQSGWAELNSEEVMARCLEVLAEAIAQAPPRSVRGMGISSQGEAFTPVNADGMALANALISSDMRAASYARSWPEGFGAEKLYRITGHTAHPMFTLFKMLWLKEHRSDVWSAASQFLCFEDLLQQRLGLDPSMGYPLAGRTMLFDVIGHRWSEEILNALGLSNSQLARVLPSGTIAGQVAPALARELGFADGAFVVTGGHDQPCGALGAAVTRPGTAMYATGTVDCITPAFDKPVFTDALRLHNLCTYDHTVAGMYVTVAFSLTGGNLLKWFRDEFGSSEVARAQAGGKSAYELLLASAGEKPSDLLVLPYFTPSGTPYFDTTTPGAILGLRLTTPRGEILRGLLEGVALEMRLNLQILGESGVEVRELFAIGGGARSRPWMQLKADVLGKPITTLHVTEAGCLGVAMLACAAGTGRDLATLASAWVRRQDVLTPHPENQAIYDRRFAQYRQLYAAIKPLYR